MGMFFGNRFFGADTKTMRRATIWGLRPLLSEASATPVSCCAQSENPVNPNYVTPCCAAQYWEDKTPWSMFGRVLHPSPLTHAPL